MNPSVTVIITTCNRLEYLKKALLSVFTQTYKINEIIVVDDNSCDGTKEYCESIKDIRYIRLSAKQHKNGSHTRNVGLKLSKSKYVAFLDDDDEWSSTKIEKQVQMMANNKDIGMVYTAAKIDINNGCRYKENYIRQDLRGDLSGKVFYNMITSTSTMLFDRNKLVRVGGFDENLDYWQDVELIIRFCQKYKIDYVNELLVVYRENLGDKKRRSNNINGYQKATEYINNKYKNEISMLSKEEKKKRDAMLALDMAVRLMKNGQYRKTRGYLKEVFKNQPTMKNFLKYLTNYTWVRSAEKCRR